MGVIKSELNPKIYFIVLDLVDTILLKLKVQINKPKHSDRLKYDLLNSDDFRLINKFKKVLEIESKTCNEMLAEMVETVEVRSESKVSNL